MLYQMLKSYIKLFKITAEPSFQAEFDSLLKEYVGRPTLFFAERLSKEYNTKYI
jgi:tryptophan synthase beta chain